MLIDGKQLAQELLDNLKKRVDLLYQMQSITPHLGIILVGNDPASEAYVRQKIKMAHQIHADATLYRYPEKIAQEDLLRDISFLQKNTLLHGLIVQLPLPTHLNEEIFINSVENSLDVDGFREHSEFEEPIALAVIKILEEVFAHEKNKAGVTRGEGIPTARNETKLSEHSREAEGPFGRNERQDPEGFKTWLKSKNIAVMGKGKTGGLPIIKMLQTRGIEFTIIDSKTENPSEITSNADILVCCVGNRGTLIHDGNIKKDATLIGIGMHKGKDGKLHGDYEMEDIKDKAGYYTPIPGGVGPLNAAMLLENVVESAEKKTV